MRVVLKKWIIIGNKSLKKDKYIYLEELFNELIIWFFYVLKENFVG